MAVDRLKSGVDKPKWTIALERAIVIDKSSASPLDICVRGLLKKENMTKGLTLGILKMILRIVNGSILSLILSGVSAYTEEIEEKIVEESDFCIV